MEEDKKSPHAHYKSMADDIIALQILGIVEEKKKISQRKITDQTGLAAGLVHSYMRKVINKGWVKAKQVSPKRWLYYLTPEGFLEKSRLTIKYFSVTLQNFHAAHSLLRDHLSVCLDNGWRKIAVAGRNELAEIAVLNIQSMRELELAGVISGDGGGEFFGREVVPFDAFDDLDCDRILVCDVKFLEWWSGQGRSAEDPRLIHFKGPMNS